MLEHNSGEEVQEELQNKQSEDYNELIKSQDHKHSKIL